MTESYDYGNARIRALKSDLFDGRRYRQLMGLDVDGLVAALADSPYRPDVVAATPRFAGVRLVQEALRTNLARTLRRLDDWYEDEGREAVRLLLGRWDLHNIRAILRGQFARRPRDDVEAILVPAGNIGEDLLVQLTSQPDLRACVEAMVVWGLPDSRTARSVLASWPEFDASGDFRTLERVLEHARRDYVATTAAEHDTVLADALGAEVDQVNVLTALRLQGADEARSDAGGRAAYFMVGGSIPIPALVRASESADRASAAGALDSAPASWRAALGRWVEAGDLVTLTDELEAAITRAAAGLFARSDPLGIGIPVAFVWAKENEARNLRTIAAGADAELPTEMIEQELVILW